MQYSKKILVAPLDWGLGHTSRCIPIIQHLLQLGATVYVAVNNTQKAYLQQEGLAVNYLILEGYNVQYKFNNMGLNIISQSIKILSSIKREHKWLQEIIKQHNFNGIISDNRYGLYTNKIPCVFITHQLQIQAPYFKRLINKINHFYIQKFTQCWVPDNSGDLSIAGNLSTLPLQHTLYIGPLSRFTNLLFNATNKNSILLILSGPEPAKTKFAMQIINTLQNTKYTLQIAGACNIEQAKVTAILLGNLSTTNLIKAIQNNSIVISRTGYSTVMDLLAMGKKAILIPTNGQTEQEYLATFLNQKFSNFFTCTTIEKLNLNVIENFNNILYTNYPITSFEAYKQVVTTWYSLLKNNNKT